MDEPSNLFRAPICHEDKKFCNIDTLSVLLAFDFDFADPVAPDDDVDDVTNLLSERRFIWQRWTKSWSSFSVSAPSSPAAAMVLHFDSCVRFEILLAFCLTRQHIGLNFHWFPG
jgi:hypothetical protein